MGKNETLETRDGFNSKLGFVLACIGSAVGMGNIWLFPYRMATYGGSFLLVYLVFDILIGLSGVIGAGRPAPGLSAPSGRPWPPGGRTSAGPARSSAPFPCWAP